jgi:hypothetical protein
MVFFGWNQPMGMVDFFEDESGNRFCVACLCFHVMWIPLCAYSTRLVLLEDGVCMCFNSCICRAHLSYELPWSWKPWGMAWLRCLLGFATLGLFNLWKPRASPSRVDEIRAHIATTPTAEPNVEAQQQQNQKRQDFQESQSPPQDQAQEVATLPGYSQRNPLTLTCVVCGKGPYPTILDLQTHMQLRHENKTTQ